MSHQRDRNKGRGISGANPEEETSTRVRTKAAASPISAEGGRNGCLHLAGTSDCNPSPLTLNPSCLRRNAGLSCYGEIRQVRYSGKADAIAASAIYI